MTKLRRAVAGFLASTAVLSVSVGASAEPVGQGTLTLGAERLAALSFTDYPDAPELGNQPTVFQLSVLASPFPVSIYQVPRISVDYFPVDGFSFGGSAYMTLVDSPDTESLTIFAAVPRVGYGFYFSEVFGVWARAGVSYFSSLSGGETSDFWAMSFEAPVFAHLTDHFAVTLGPSADIGITEFAPSTYALNAGGMVHF